MAEKLSKEVWVAFTRKNKLSLEDSALLKALEKFDKCDEKQHEARSAALEGIVEQVKKQVVLLAKVKKDLGDKLFGLAKDKLYELLDEAEKLQKSDGKRTEKAEKAEEAEDEEADSPTLLTSAMIPLVRTLQKGGITMPALIAVTSKKTAVLISRRAISPSRRKLLAEYLQESGGIKYLVAQCTGASGELEFQLDSSPGGLSKRLKQAVLDQTNLRTRIVLRFGEESESDGEEDADNDTPAAAATGAARPQSFVAFTQTRLAWDQTRKAVQADLRKLEAEILARCKDESDFADIQVGAKTLYEMLDVLDERLIDKLDEALNATTPQTRQQLHLQAREIVDEYLEFVETDELVADIDANGFVDTAVRATLTTRLQDMAGRLAAGYGASHTA